MRDHEKNAQENPEVVHKTKLLNLPKIRLQHRKEPQSHGLTRRVKGNAMRNYNYTHNTSRYGAKNIPKLTQETRNDDFASARHCIKEKKVVPIKGINLPFPKTLFSRASMASSPQKKLRPRSFKNFWSDHPKSLDIHSLVLTRDIDALSIEIVRMYNEPFIALPKLDMEPAGT